MVKLILHLEGLVFFVIALYLYSLFNGNWWIFAAVVLVPDISMLGYIKNKDLGATIYNLVHNYVLAFGLMTFGYFVFQNMLVVYSGIILLAHVGIDRFMGYGLKYPSHFKDTHLQKV